MLHKFKYLLSLGSIFSCLISSSLHASPFSPETRVVSLNAFSANESKVDIAFNSSAKGIMVWNDISSNRIYARHIKQDGTSISSDIIVSIDSTITQKDPSVGIDAQGNFAIVWVKTTTDGKSSVVIRRYNTNGSAGSETLVHTNTTGNHYDPDLAMLADGRFIITWASGYQDGFGDIYARRYAANGAPLAAETRINSTTSYAQVNPQIAINSEGVYAIAWEAQGMVAGLDIAFSSFDINGNTIIPETMANTEAPYNDQSDAVIAINNQGNLAVAWHCFCDGSGMGIKAKRFAATGSVIGNEFAVNTFKTNNQNYPSLALDQNNNLFVAWKGENNISKVTSIYGQFFFPDNSLNGQEFRISNEVNSGSTIYPQINPVAIIDANGIHRVSWVGSRATGAGTYYSSAFTIDAGKDKAVNAGSVDLFGTSNLNLAVNTWEWLQTQGTPVVLATNNQSHTSFDAPATSGTLTFKLSATFTDGSKAQDFINVDVVRNIPNVNAGADQQITEGYATQLSGNASATNGGTIAQYHWTQTVGPQIQLDDPYSSVANFVVPLVGDNTDLVFTLTATDNEGAIGSDTVIVRAININLPPQANASDDKIANENTQVVLNGSATDADGTIATYQWQQISGPTVNLLNANTANALFNAPYVASDAQLVFEFRATDNNGATATDTLNVTLQNNVSNLAPVVNAGIDRIVTSGLTVNLNGTAQDTDGNISQVQWAQISGPAIIFSSLTALATTFVAPDVSVNTPITLSLTVTDNEGAISTDILIVTLAPKPPIVYCSSKGTTATYEWIASVGVNAYTKVSGKNNGYVSFPATPDLYLQKGAANPISLTPGFSSGSYSESWSLWVDINRNGTFETTERFYSGTGNQRLTGNIVLPASATAGETQMRVSMRWGAVPGPCETFSYGEVEDYRVIIR